MKQPLTVDKLVYRLRLMAESGGMITRDRRNVIIEAANMLEDQEERISIMSEHEYINSPIAFAEGDEASEKC